MDGIQDYGLLNTQTDPRFGARKYGRFGTVAKNGCGLIALYNVERAAFEEVRFDPYYASRKPIRTNLFGLLGTKPSSVRRNLEQKGYRVESISKRETENAKPYDAVIVLYWYWFGAHYVTGIAEENGLYRLYNQFTEPYAMQLPKFLRYLREHKKHVVRIWGIRFPSV